MSTWEQRMAKDVEGATVVGRGLEDLRRNGFAVLEDVMPGSRMERVQRLLDEVRRQELADGTAWLQPPSGQRVWMLLNKGHPFLDLVTESAVLDVADALVGAPVLLSNATAHVVGPGTEAQAIHTDQGYLPSCVTIPMVLTAIWMVNDFTEANGATVVIPGSHEGLVGEPRRVTGRSGSVLLMDGRLRHGAGSSTADACERRAIIVNYCSPVLRQQENVWRSLDPMVLAAADERLLRLLGDELYDSLGMVNGLSRAWRPKAAAAFGPSWS
jgi:Phytanoyl-CoA dioxygenase (PhyH)